MHIISRKALLEFAKRYPASYEALDDWYRVAKKATWQSIADVKAIFPHADAVGDCTVFNIGGNKYRLITRISYEKQVIFIRFVLTHSEYDKGSWKNEC
jgi:mRNA interferase HigB